MSSFKKPNKSNIYKRFLYIDEKEVLNSLSGIQGGEIDQIFQRLGEGGDGGLGFDVAVDVPGIGRAGGKASKNKNKKLEQEILRKRTVQSATVALLDHLHENEAIGIIEGAYTPEIYEELEENMPVEFQADIRIHPLNQLVSVVQGWSEMAANFGISKKEAREFTEIARQIEAAFHGRDKSKKTMIIFAETDGQPQEYKLVLPIHVDDLMVSLDELSGTATFVAQVDRIVEEDKEVLAARVVRNSPVLPAERNMMLEMLPALQELQGDEGIGLKIDRDDIVLSKPSVLLKPICIYR